MKTRKAMKKLRQVNLDAVHAMTLLVRWNNWMTASYSTSEPIGDSNTMKRSTDIDETVEALRTLRTNTMSSWSGCVDTAGITDCGASHDEARAQDAADAADAAEGHWDRAIEAVESGDIATAKQELEWARSLAAEWGDSTCETQALEVVDQAGGGDDDDEEDIDDCYIRTVRHA